MNGALLTVLLLGTSLQDPREPASGPSAVEASEQTNGKVDVTALRDRIHGMRQQVLLGGDKVQQAQAEASAFYKLKIDELDRGLDSTRVDLSEKRASYQLALERTLDGAGSKARTGAIREAAGLRAQITSLESERDQLEHRRKQLSTMVRRVEAHGRERERLAARLEATSEPAELLTMSLPPVGLAPEIEVGEAEVGLDDELIRDLLARDEPRARRVLFEADPARYWALFRLQPPHAALRQALVFPPADLPGQR